MPYARAGFCVLDFVNIGGMGTCSARAWGFLLA